MPYSDRHSGVDSGNGECWLRVFLHRQRCDYSQIFLCVCLNLMLARWSRFGDAAFTLHAAPCRCFNGASLSIPAVTAHVCISIILSGYVDDMSKPDRLELISLVNVSQFKCPKSLQGCGLAVRIYIACRLSA